jgi:hypothetical protein
MAPRDLDRIRFVTRYFNELQGLREAVPYGLQTLGLGVVLFFPNPATIGLFVVLLAGSVALRQGAGAYYQRLFGEVENRPLALGAPAALPSVFRPAGPSPLLEAPRPRGQFSRRQWQLLAGAVVLYLVLRAISPTVALLTDDSAADPWLRLHAPVVETFEGTSPLDRTLTLGPMLLQSSYVLTGAVLVGIWLRRERRLSQLHYLLLGTLLLALAFLGASLGFVLPALWKLGIARLGAVFLPPVAHLSMALILCGTALTLSGLLDHWQLVRTLGHPAAPQEG